MSAKKFKKNDFSLRDCGTMAYFQTLNMQLELVNQRQQGRICNTVLLVEHPPVITLGARKTENVVLASSETLKKKQIDLVAVRRGGGTTAHNPGQIVVYPIIDLRSLALGVNEYIRELEAVGIELLAEFGITAQRRKNLPGLWVEERKIGSIGVKIKRHVSYHGMAINISNDLSIFDLIVPCGLKGVKITNVAGETGREIAMSEVKELLGGILRKHFAKEVQP